MSGALTVTPITLREANAFVRRHHRHRGKEWFPGAACWDCGWEAEPDEHGHCWSRDAGGASRHERLGLRAPVCLACGIVKPKHPKGPRATKCRGFMARVAPRKDGQ